MVSLFQGSVLAEAISPTFEVEPQMYYVSMALKTDDVFEDLKWLRVEVSMDGATWVAYRDLPLGSGGSAYHYFDTLVAPYLRVKTVSEFTMLQVQVFSK